MRLDSSRGKETLEDLFDIEAVLMREGLFTSIWYNQFMEIPAAQPECSFVRNVLEISLGRGSDQMLTTRGLE